MKVNKATQEYSIPNHGFSAEQKMKADEELRIERFKRLSQINDSNRIYAELLRLKYEILDYLDLNVYDQDHSFGSYLKKYIQIFGIKRKELAANLSIHETKFSRIINNKENPGLNILYRLEEHSNLIIRADLLWKLVTRKIENEIRLNKQERRTQSKRVKNKFKYDTGRAVTNTGL